MFSLANSIARQFIIKILLFSMVITTILTATQLYMDYTAGIKEINSKVNLIEKTYLQSITNTVWVFDMDTLNIQIDGLSELPDFQYIEINDLEKTIASLGKSSDKNIISKTFPLIYQYNGKPIHLGTMEIVFSLNGLYHNLVKKIFIITVTQGIKTFLVSFFIFVIFYQLVGRHLEKIARYSQQLKSNTLQNELILDSPSDHKQNELDQLVTSLNSMRRNFIRHHKQIEENQHELTLFKAKIEQSRDCMCIINPKTAIILDINEAVVQMLGYQKNEIIGKTAMDISTSFSNIDEWKTFMQTISNNKAGSLKETRYISKSGKTIPVEASSKLITLDDESIFVSFARDISERKEAQKILEFQAQHDQLTKLPNRALLEDRIGQLILDVERNQGKVALLFLDLDHFKHINDSYGHNFGDKVLLLVSERLKSVMRKNDTLARLGGDEFVALTRLNNASDGASHMAHKFIESLTEPFNQEGVQLVLKMSIGISIYPDDSDNAELLLRNADAAMYKAKSIGRNNFQFYSPELTAQAEQRIQIESDINQAIVNNEFIVYYQPQISSSSNKIIGAEALVRWNHPVKGFMSPATFIPIAEQTGQINLIDKWVLEHVANFIVHSENKGIHIPKIAVNFSGRDFDLDPISESVSEIINNAKCPAQKIEIEITESQLMSRPEECIKDLEKLKKMGINISIDDFGTGYSSLNYLKKLPISKLKIDQSFVQEVTHDKNDQAIVRAIIALGKSLNLELIAEGVETVEQEKFITAEGCSQIQGYLHSKPLPEADFITYLTKQGSPSRIVT